MDLVQQMLQQDVESPAGETVQPVQKRNAPTPREKFEIEVVLHTGEIVGSWSREWLIECEAKYLLKMPLQQRRAALEARVQKRGAESVAKLKAEMLSIHQHQKQNKPVA